MKIDHQDTSPAGNAVLTLRIGVEEIDILRGLIAKAIKYTPKTFETQSTLQRIASMHRTLNSDEVKAFCSRMPESV